MKKGWMKKFLCIGLAVAMTVSLPACGKKKDANSGLAKEHVYKYQEIALPDLGEDFRIQGAVLKDGTIYLLTRVYHWNDENYTGNDTDFRIVNMKEDGSDVKIVTLEIPEDNNSKTPSNGGIAVPMPGLRSAPLSAASSSFVPPTANVEAPDAETDTDAEADSSTETDTETEAGANKTEDGTAVPDIDVDIDVLEPMEPGTDDNIYISEHSNYNNFSIGADGSAYAIRRYYYYYEDYVNPENSVSFRKQYLCTWNTDGSFRKETEIEGLETEEEYLYIAGMSIDAQGNASLLLSGDAVYKVTVDAQGKASEKMKLPDDLEKVFNNMENMVDRGNGDFWMLYRDENEWEKLFIAGYNMGTGVLGGAKELPASFGYGGYNSMTAGINSDLLYSTSTGLYSLNGGDAESTLKMDFINSDINIYGFDGLVELDEDKFLGIFSEAYDNTVKAGIFTYVKPEEIRDKSVLVLASMWMGGSLRQRIVEFNRNSEDYRIVVKTYQDYNSYEDRDAGITKLNYEIISGGMPDILVTSGLPVDNYAAKGLLADIGEMIKKDEELSKVEFMDNVFQAYSMHDKLYYVIPSFSARTMVGKTSIVGDRNTWTMKDAQELMASLPAGTNLLTELSRDRFFELAMEFCGNDFVDVEAGKCNFNSEGFIALMEYAKTLPEELGEDYFGEDYWMHYESQYRENRTVLCDMGIGSVRNMNFIINGYFGEPVSYIGFPTESGQGAYVEANQSFAISAKSRYKDVAWEFLRYYLTDEYQSELYGFPIQRKYFMEQAQEATERPFWTDENGNKVEYDDTFWINGESIIIPPMSQEQLDAAVAMIESITKHPYQNTDLMNIINEDMGAFFSGQKSAKEVADLIQNRAQLYVDENR